MEEWLKKKKLSEAYTVCQQRDTRKQQEIENEARSEYSQGIPRYNRSGYKTWLTQRRNQGKYEQMNRAMMAQMQAEAAQ